MRRARRAAGGGGATGLVKDEVITAVDIQGTSVSEVRLLRNTNSLYDTNPRIIATNVEIIAIRIDNPTAFQMSCLFNTTSNHLRV